jgi:hypothetical protein
MTSPLKISGTIVVSNSTKSDKDCEKDVFSTNPQKPPEYAMLLECRRLPMDKSRYQSSEIGILSVTLSDTYADLITKITELRDAELFEVHTVEGTLHHLTVRWCDSDRERKPENFVTVDEEVKLCLALMKQRGWKDTFVATYI